MKKPPQKVAYLWQLEGFFSTAPSARNSPEVHFRFINSPIHSSALKSVWHTYIEYSFIFLLTGIIMPGVEKLRGQFLLFFLRKIVGNQLEKLFIHFESGQFNNYKFVN